MTKKAFKRWNWEYDFGEQPLPDDQPFPPRYAIAHFDYKGHLYRVTTRVKMRVDASDDDPSAFETFAYDYFCDENGRILQKRSLGDGSEVELIVYLEYNDERNEVTETAWSPKEGLSRRHTRTQRRG